MYFQHIASVFPEFAKRELVDILTGVERFCGRSPQSWVLGDSRLDRFMISSSSVPERLAPGYYTSSSF
ncbi:hypothetical protein BJ165DRAFT_1469254 [Panaeolus papilionaceus]|nr:hypothetical protein BJ165DRAFT_1469254 [Panaeolus papilionaceus]